MSDARKSALGKSSLGEDLVRFLQKLKESISHFKGKTNKLVPRLLPIYLVKISFFQIRLYKYYMCERICRKFANGKKFPMKISF